jgi:hypothetical protein
VEASPQFPDLRRLTPSRDAAECDELARGRARCAGPERWPLAGDQLFVDLDLSADNLPPGTQLTIGSAVIEVTSQPHTGCNKFVSRFGVAAMKFVNSAVGRQLNLRGINARVTRPGAIRVGDIVRVQRSDQPLYAEAQRI